MELLEDPSLLIQWYAGPGARHRDGERNVPYARGNAHFSSVSELDGVADEVEERLREALLVALGPLSPCKI